MITQDKVTEIYSLADDFCKFFCSQVKSRLLEKPSKTRKYHRDNKMSEAEIITILVLFHMMGYRCLKHFYVNHVCTHMQDMFPNTDSDVLYRPISVLRKYRKCVAKNNSPA